MIVKKINSVLIILISIIIVLSWILPYGKTFFIVDTDSGYWKNLYVVEDVFLLVAILLTTISWITFFIFRWKLIKKISAIFLIILSFIVEFISISSVAFINPDWLPGIGSIICGTIFPLVCVFLYNTRGQFLN